MGLFSSKKKKKFYTAVQRMIDDDQIVLSSKAAVTNYLFSSSISTSVMGKSLPDHIIEAAMNNMPSKYKAGYRYAAKGYYEPFGLPTAATTQAAVDVTLKVKEAVELEVGTTVDLLYAEIGEANYYHFMWKILIESHGYNPTTNELENLSVLKGSPCYLTTARVEYCTATADSVEDSTYFDQWGLSTESGQTTNRIQDLNKPLISYVIDDALLEDRAVITYEYLNTVADTTPPPVFKPSFFDGLLLKGIAEKGATVLVHDAADVFITSGVASATGYFEVTLVSSTSTVKVYVKDAVNNISTVVDITSPFEDTAVVEPGDDPTQTIFRIEETFNFDFLAYIESSTPSDTDVQVPDITYIMSAYTYDNAGTTEIKYLTYIYGSDVNPALEDVVNFESATGEFFPRLYARLNGDNLGNLPSTDPKVKASKKMAKKLGMEWKGWVEQLHEAIDDVTDVQQLFITLAAPVNTTDVVTCEYLYRYFYKLYTEQPEAPVGFVPPLGDAFNIKEGLSLRIADNEYAHHVQFSAIGFDTVTGNIGEVGHYTSTYVPEITNSVLQGLLVRRVAVAAAYHSIKWQVTETEYQEVRVYRLSSAHRFSGGGTSVSGTNEALIIPLDRSVLPRMNTAELEILFGKCLHLFINILKIIKVKWYQTGVFKVVMAVIAIVVSVVFPPAGAAAYAGWAALAYAAAYAVVVGLVISLALKLVVKLLVSLGVSAEIVGIIAIVAAIVALAYGDGSSLAQVLDVSANTLLQVSNVAFQIVAGMQAYELNEIAKQMDAFQEQAKAKWELLEDAQKMLDTGTTPISLEVLMGDLRSKVLIRLGESPETFLMRSIGMSNVGTLGYEMVSNYVDSCLVLPDMNTMIRQTS